MSESDTKECPYCAETIKLAAIKCRYCGSDLHTSPPAGGASGLNTPKFSALLAHDFDTSRHFEITLDRWSIEPTRFAPFHYAVLRGTIVNCSGGRASFHLLVAGGTVVGDEALSIGMPGMTETESLTPGGTTEWIVRLPLADATPPDLLGYRVQTQDFPGELEVTTITALDEPWTLGSMQPLMTNMLLSNMLPGAQGALEFATGE